MQALWWETLDPTRDSLRFVRRFYRSWERCFASTARRLLGSAAPSGFDGHYGIPLLGEEPYTAEWFDLVHSYGSFGELIDHVHLPADDPEHALVERVKELCRLRVAMLSPEMVGAVRAISVQFMLWLRKHPQVLESVSWQAFERIMAEMFAGKGFVVHCTGRSRNETCDIFAVTTDALGAETRYLIECKRYQRSRHIGLAIVNQVIGAAKRRNVDHAFLVTTSRFTRDVLAQRATFRDIRLHLRDGDELARWLHDYQPRADAGLWLNEGWDETI